MATKSWRMVRRGCASSPNSVDHDDFVPPSDAMRPTSALPQWPVKVQRRIASAQSLRSKPPVQYWLRTRSSMLRLRRVEFPGSTPEAPDI